MRIVQERSYGVVPVRLWEGAWQFLIVQHCAGHWGFPKGRPQHFEVPKTTARRELAEETNLSVRRFFKNIFQESYKFVYQDIHIEKTVHLFLAEVIGDLKIQAQELEDARWGDVSFTYMQLSYSQAKEACQASYQALLRERPVKPSKLPKEAHL